MCVLRKLVLMLDGLSEWLKDLVQGRDILKRKPVNGILTRSNPNIRIFDVES